MFPDIRATCVSEFSFYHQQTALRSENNFVAGTFFDDSPEYHNFGMHYFNDLISGFIGQ